LLNLLFCFTPILTMIHITFMHHALQVLDASGYVADLQASQKVYKTLNISVAHAW